MDFDIADGPTVDGTREGAAERMPIVNCGMTAIKMITLTRPL